MKTCVLLNKKAGKLLHDRHSAQLLGEFADEVRELSPDKPTAELISELIAADYKRLIVGGGDGTINSVVNALAGRFDQVQLGILPLGTANDFARTIHIPPDLERAIATLREGHKRRVDVGKVTTGDDSRERYFLNVAVGGFSSIAKEKLDETRKDLWKVLAYAVSAFKALPELEEYALKLRLDDEYTVELSAFNVVVANAMFAGGGFPVAPEAIVDDGLFDVVVTASGTVPEMAGLAGKALRGEHMEDDNIFFRRAKKVELSSEPTFYLTTDGERIGCCPAQFEVLPGVLEMLVGPQPRG